MTNELAFVLGSLFDYHGFEKVSIQMNTENTQAHYIQYKNLQNYAEAITDYTKAIQLNPNDADAYYNRGNIHCVLKEYSKAIADFTKAIKKNKNFAVAYNNRGCIYSRLNKFSKAISDATKAIIINPISAFYYSNRGEYYYSFGNKEKAYKDWQISYLLGSSYAKDLLDCAANNKDASLFFKSNIT